MKDLLLLHGALGHPDLFQPYEARLSEHFRLHKLLFEGHGGRPIPASGLRIGQYVDQVEAYCQEKGLESVSIFGYSMGGYVGLSWAARNPQRVSALLTLATKLEWTEQGARKEISLLDPEKIKEKVPAFAAHLARLHGAEKWDSLLPAVAGLMLELGKEPPLSPARLQGLSTRVQLMVGDQDNMVSLDETRAAVASIPNARLAVLPGTPHPFEKVRNDLLLPLMRDFLCH